MIIYSLPTAFEGSSLQSMIFGIGMVVFDFTDKRAWISSCMAFTEGDRTYNR
jgi:hypothetical protein